MNSTNKNNSNVVESENIIELKNITKQYEDLVVLDNLNLDIKKNEFLTLLGPSGCGKTTTLKIIAGFEHADEGEVMFEGENVNDTPPYERQVNTVFQKYVLFPHMNVYENIAFGLKIKKMDKATIDVKVKEMLKLVESSSGQLDASFEATMDPADKAKVPKRGFNPPLCPTFQVTLLSVKFTAYLSPCSTATSCSAVVVAISAFLFPHDANERVATTANENKIFFMLIRYFVCSNVQY